MRTIVFPISECRCLIESVASPTIVITDKLFAACLRVARADSYTVEFSLPRFWAHSFIIAAL